MLTGGQRQIHGHRMSLYLVFSCCRRNEINAPWCRDHLVGKAGKAVNVKAVAPFDGADRLGANLKS